MAEWTGAAVAIVAGGPSFTAADARLLGIARAKGQIRVIAVNDAVYPCWFADIVYACDPSWWRHHGSLPGFAGRKIRLHFNDGKPEPNIANLEVFRTAGKTGICVRPGFVKTGFNSTYQALQVAIQQGSRNIIFVGLDMSGEAHWFGDHPKGVKRGAPVVATMIRNFECAAPLLQRMGVEVANASPESRVNAFTKVRLSDWLQALEAQ